MAVVVSLFICALKVENGTPQWWSLYTDGRYPEVVVNSGLSVSNYLYSDPKPEMLKRFVKRKHQALPDSK